MTKEQQIAKYGIEWYEAYKAKSRARHKERYTNDTKYREDEKTKSRARNKERYTNDTKYREAHKASMNAYCKERYVIGGRVDLIENYDKANADNFKGWHIHHRLELHPDCSLRFTKTSLLKLGLYYNRPPTELIWVTKSEHSKMHNLGKKNE